jgi:hypothetical protein
MVTISQGVTMNTNRDALLDRGQTVTAAAAILGKWYASHSIVRRLWAIEASEAIRIVLTLEPTLDGDDTQPAWLANSWSWAQELRVRLQRQVHLELINEPSARVEASCDIASASITEISWRDASRDTD